MNLNRLQPHSFSFPAARAALLCLCALSAWMLYTAVETKKTLDSIKTADTFFSPTDRVLILAPHPDDETLAAGGLIQKAVAQKIPLAVCFLTYGDNNAWSAIVEKKLPLVSAKEMRTLGEQRRTEALSALAALGVSRDAVSFLGFPDFHTLDLFCQQWNSGKPAKAGFTNVLAVPYDTAQTPGAPYTAPSLLDELKKTLVSFKPTVVVLAGGHPADFNGDHRALYLFSRVALWDLNMTSVRLLPALIHYPRWPQPEKNDDALSLLPPQPWEGSAQWTIEPLTPNERAAKKSAIALHASQYRTSANYFRRFLRANELFGDFSPVVLPPFATATTHQSANPEKESVANRLIRFVKGSNTTSVFRDEKNITVTMRFTRPLGKQTAATVFVFGYTPKTPFTAMPKLCVRFGNVGYSVYDGDKHLPDRAVRVKRTLMTVSVSVPISLLNDPDRLFLGVNAHLLSAAPIDLTSWRIIELPAE